MEKTVHLKITTTFVTYKDYEVEGNLTDEEILEQANNDGDFLEDVLDTLDIDTVVEFDEEERKYCSSFEEDDSEDIPLDRDNPILKELYKQYVKEWKKDHSGPECKGMEPVCFDEWYDNEYLEAFAEEEGKRNGWQIAIDLTGVDENGTPEENLEMIGSPLFETEEEADAWYRSLEITGNDLARINKGLDIIMIHWVNGKIEDTYVY
mgnify:CR=1 FL=1